MIERLYVSNFALIDEMEVELKKGLNVLSGETGAGKSIIIGALTFVLGGKADRDVIKRGCDMMEASVLVSVDNDVLKKELEDIDVNVDDDGFVLIKRTFNTSGKSYCKINGKNVTVSMLREVSSKLVDIHGQHDHQSLLDPRSHIVMLDRLCSEEIAVKLERLGSLYSEYKSISRKLKEIDLNDDDIRDRVEIYKYQIDEIEGAGLKKGEDEELAERRNILMNSVKLREYADECLNCLYRSDGSAAENIGNSIYALENLNNIDSSLEKTLASLNDAYAVIEDIVRSVREYSDTIESDPRELDEIEERLQLIYELKNKYGGSIERILIYLDKVKEKLDIIENSEALAEEYSNKKKKIESEIRALCAEITNIRCEMAENAGNRIEKVLKELSMEDAVFKISVTAKEGFDEKGMDNVEFLISANKGEEPKPLSKIASGGEMSRVMLAIKNVLADVDNIDTFVFDEIDTGISGRTAQKVAEKMLHTAKKHQIICITHLPQIAAVADHNFLIEKTTADDTTSTNIVELSGEKVYNEIARLIGGAVITDSTLKAAEEMKIMADRLKEN